MKVFKRIPYFFMVLTQITILTIFYFCYATAAEASTDTPTSKTTSTHASSNDFVTMHSTIDWQQWDADVFKQAKKDNKLVLLNLEAVWCHWCHVMDKLTYSEKDVIAKLSEHYIAVKVDHDANPGLANKYRNYGWPATIIFDADGNELVKRAGYIDTDTMTRILDTVVAATTVADKPQETLYENKLRNNPRNAPAMRLRQTNISNDNALLSDDLRSALIRRHQTAYDEKEGGLRINQKFLDRDSVEYSMSQAQGGNSSEQKRANHTLTAALNLLDPAWGGFYQYSTQGDWQHAHYEKIMRVQASYLRLYALAYAQFAEAKYLHATDEIRRYLNRFLKSSSGVYFVSQDADLIQGEHSDDYFALSSRGRFSLGIPKVDSHVYAQENGWIIEALATLYEATGDNSALDEALTATTGVLQKHYNFRSKGFIHDASSEQVQNIYYLADNLAMARAFLQLYRVTANTKWLTLSTNTTDFIQQHFYSSIGGYIGNEDLGLPVKPEPDIDENISLARFTNLLSHYTGDSRYNEMSKHAMRFLGREDIATQRLTEAGILLLNDELASAPWHIIVVGDKNNSAANEMFAAGLNNSRWYKRIDWWHRNEGELQNSDVNYPELKRPAAFLCTDNRCSLPVFSVQALNQLLEETDSMDTNVDEINKDTLSRQTRSSKNIKLESITGISSPTTMNSFVRYHLERTSSYASVIF